MKSKSHHVEKIWRHTRTIFFIFPFLIALIVGINAAYGPERSGGTALQQIGYGLLMLAFAALVYGFSWLVFKLVRAWAEHEDGRR